MFSNKKNPPWTHKITDHTMDLLQAGTVKEAGTSYIVCVSQKNLNSPHVCACSHSTHTSSLIYIHVRNVKKMLMIYSLTVLPQTIHTTVVPTIQYCIMSVMLHIYNSLYHIAKNVGRRKHWQIDLFTLIKLANSALSRI